MSVDLPRSPRRSAHSDISHYALASQMINYQSHDVGAQCEDPVFCTYELDADDVQFYALEPTGFMS